MLIDAFSSSEAIGMGTSVSSGTAAEHTAHFTLSPEVRVLDPESNKDVTPGSGEVGVLALGGRNPVGYYKDPDKSAATFKVIDGVRYSVPGDFATVDADGAIHLLGRGSVVINTGGEKVFPEEVEEVAEAPPRGGRRRGGGHPRRALRRRWWRPRSSCVPGRSATEAELVEHVRGHLAAFKAPKRVHFVRDHRTLPGRQGGLRPPPGRDHRVGLDPGLTDASAAPGTSARRRGAVAGRARAAAGVVRLDAGPAPSRWRRTPGTSTRRFPWASVTKLLVAMAVLVAVEEGTLGTRRPGRAPGIDGAPPAGPRVGTRARRPGPSPPPGRRRIYSNVGYEVLADLRGPSRGHALHRLSPHRRGPPLWR